MSCIFTYAYASICRQLPQNDPNKHQQGPGMSVDQLAANVAEVIHEEEEAERTLEQTRAAVQARRDQGVRLSAAV